MKFLKQMALSGILFTSLAAAAQTGETRNVMNLKDCINYTLQHNPTIPIFSNDVKSANQKKIESLSGYMPQINGSVAWDDNLKRQVTVLPGAVLGRTEDVRVQFGNQYNTTAAVQADQTIYDQSLLSGLSAIKPNIEAAQLKKEKNDDDIVYNTATAYYQVITYKEQLKLLNENEKKFAEIVRIQQLQYDKGVLKQVDLDRVKVALNNIRSQKKFAETSMDVALNRLKFYMGMPLNESLTVTDSAASLQEVSLPAYNDFEPKNTWDIKIQAKTLLLQEINIKRMKAGYIPTLGFYARYGGQAFGNDFAQSFKNWFDYSSIGLRLNVPIFDGLRKSSQIRQTTLQYNNAQQNYKITESTARLAN
ncbi:MAG TPA: TolC family protein, partial [Chitinophagales bacterium]|nr:TolC family protein [Chitinophagales bacterium]